MEIHGTCEPGFERVREAFARCFAELGETGAATCVYLDGRAVAHLWGGMADAATGRPWRRDTLVHVYSVTKAFAAACLLALVERGLVDLDLPMARYWPEFAQAGKERVPVRWLLTHQAGLLGIRRPLPPDAIFDWERIVAALVAEEPWWEPGARVGEHAWFFGHLVGEVVRRVDGRSLGTFLRDEIAGPWDLDFHVGLPPAEQARSATVTGMDAAWREATLGEPGSMRAQALANPPAMLDGAVINSPAWRAAEVPAVNGHGTAHAVARFYGGLALGGALDGVRLLSPALVGEATARQATGEDALLGREVSWGLGFQVDADGFGMGGLGGALGWGNAEHRFGFSYVTNRMTTHTRALAVYAAAAEAAGFTPAIEE